MVPSSFWFDQSDGFVWRKTSMNIKVRLMTLYTGVHSGLNSSSFQILHSESKGRGSTSRIYYVTVRYILTITVKSRQFYFNSHRNFVQFQILKTGQTKNLTATLSKKHNSQIFMVSKFAVP